LTGLWGWGRFGGKRGLCFLKYSEFLEVMMKRPFVIFAILCFSFLGGCKDIKWIWESKEVKEQKEKQLRASMEQKRARDRELKYRTEAILLSMKYKIDENIVFNMLSGQGLLEFDTQLDQYFLGNSEDQVDFETWLETWLIETPKKERENILAYSKKYDIPPDIIASIFIDYEVMKRCETY
jgi:hypothetical protein